MSFSAQIGTFCNNTKTKLQRVRKGVIFKLFSAIILDTPVLTGRLRGNWQLTEKAPSPDVLPNEDKAGTATIGKILQQVNQTTGEFAVYLTNNLPYAYRIEFEGWSHTKAPLGMVRLNIIRFNQLIKIETTK